MATNERGGFLPQVGFVAVKTIIADEREIGYLQGFSECRRRRAEVCGGGVGAPFRIKLRTHMLLK
jgi:hypothetical protein